MRHRVVCGLALLVWGGICPAAPPFPVAAVAERSIAREQVFDATVEAVNQSTVSAQVAGRIEAIYVDVDDYVPRDTLILRMRNPEQRAGVDEAQAALKEAQARYQQATANFTRIQSVYARRLVAKSALDQASAELKASKARLDAAQAGIVQAQERLGHTEVRAPYSGIVVKRHVEVGESVTVGQPLLTGLSLDALRAVAEVPQTFIDAIRTQARARVLLPGPDQSSAAVSALTVFPYADPQTHSFKVRVSLPPGLRGIYPGMVLKVAFVTGEQRALLVPAQAVVHRSEVTGVYVVDQQGGVSLRQLRVGRAQPDGTIEVLAGLQAGERVALDPIRAGVYLKNNP